MWTYGTTVLPDKYTHKCIFYVIIFKRKKGDFEDVTVFLLDKENSSPQPDSIMVLW